MRHRLEKLQKEALEKILSANDLKTLAAIETQFLSRKSELISVLRGVKDLPAADRPMIGQLANTIRGQIQAQLNKKKSSLESGRDSFAVDASLPGQEPDRGYLHPLSQFMRRVIRIFHSMGFEVVEGREVENTEYNFELLNIKADHPARDLWDTFYVEAPDKKNTDELVLRTHTSPAQIRAMETRRPPIRLIVPGRVFRHEATDASHEATFYQCEGLVIGQGVAVSDLIGTLKLFLQELFGQSVQIRLRPEYYPFVEPGMDVDMRCLICKGEGCSVCRRRGWLEMLGSGMVHPQVLQNMNLDPRRYSGFAFGLGIDRLMMLFHGIDDIRASFVNDFRFLHQFTQR
ncbi:MAG: phenylalanine--tRNA ligase subunit alpha [bacterium]|nr:phenylalanine--tRNA ligase subunit alpha [bacterium]